MAALDLSKLSKFLWFQHPFSKAYEVKNYSVATIILCYFCMYVSVSHFYSLFHGTVLQALHSMVHSFFSVHEIEIFIEQTLV